MARSITKMEEYVFRMEFQNWIMGLNENLIEYQEIMIALMRETDITDFTSHKDVINAAKHAFLCRILSYYQQEAAVDQVNHIISSHK